MGEASGAAGRSDALNRARNLRDLPGGRTVGGVSEAAAIEGDGGAGTTPAVGTVARTRPTQARGGGTGGRQLVPTETPAGEVRQPTSRTTTAPRTGTQPSGRRRLRSGTLINLGLASTTRKTLLGS